MAVFFSKFSQNLCQAPLCHNAQSAHINAQFSTHDMKDPLQQKQTMPLISRRVLFACFYDVPNFPLQKQDFPCFVGPTWYPLETFELNVREQNKLVFWNISLWPTSGASFIKISPLTFLTCGTISQTMIAAVPSRKSSMGPCFCNQQSAIFYCKISEGPRIQTNVWWRDDLFRPPDANRRVCYSWKYFCPIKFMQHYRSFLLLQFVDLLL